MYAYAKGSCPNAATASREIISLPMHLGLKKTDIDMISDLILKYAK
jgi:dTDP-4-amino-4,6-dideoxygalactose transaminase